MPSDRPAPGAPLSRRRLVQRLVLGGTSWPVSQGAGARTATDPGAERLQIGIAEPSGSGRQALAMQWAERLGRRLRQPVEIRLWPAPSQEPAEAWLVAGAGRPRVLFASRWGGSAPGDEGLRSVAVLAREPLVLVAGRQLPPGLAAMRDGARAAAGRWRCGVDAAAEAAANPLLEALGLSTAVTTVAFRGPAQLLPAVVGGRIELAVRTVGLYLGEAWSALSLDEAAGNLGDAVGLHRRGELRLLAVADRRRLPGASEVPTLHELLGRPRADMAEGRCLHLLAPADGPIRFSRLLARAAAGLAVAS